MTKRKNRRAFSPEFKAKAVSLCRAGDRSIKQVAQDLDLVETALRRWVSQAEVDVGKGPPGALTSNEREELAQLRRENKRLKEEREILKAAATFFAKESK
jgi:transposase